MTGKQRPVGTSLHEAMITLAGETDIRLPPHDPDADLSVGDQLVVTEGEQRGWTGTVTWVDERSRQVAARMVRRDGTTGPQVIHREECVAKIGLAVPSFHSVEAADEWLEQHRRTPYPSGTPVVFTAPPHLAQRLEEDPNSTEWITRHFEREYVGRVVRSHAPSWAAGPTTERSVLRPAFYELLAVVDGEPEIVEVPTERVLRMA